MGVIDLGCSAWVLFGKDARCHAHLEHPSVSRQHAVVQCKPDGSLHLHDLRSTHGTYVNKTRVPANTYVLLADGNLVTFGTSTRMYIVSGSTVSAADVDEQHRTKRQKIAPMSMDVEATKEKEKEKKTANDVHSADVMRAEEHAVYDDEDDFFDTTRKRKQSQKERKAAILANLQGVHADTPVSFTFVAPKKAEVPAETPEEHKENPIPDTTSTSTSTSADPLEQYLQKCAADSIKADNL